jgi:hypothetical protein
MTQQIIECNDADHRGTPDYFSVFIIAVSLVLIHVNGPPTKRQNGKCVRVINA